MSPVGSGRQQLRTEPCPVESEDRVPGAGHESQVLGLTVGMPAGVVDCVGQEVDDVVDVQPDDHGALPLGQNVRPDRPDSGNELVLARQFRDAVPVLVVEEERRRDLDLVVVLGPGGGVRVVDHGGLLGGDWSGSSDTPIVTPTTV